MKYYHKDTSLESLPLLYDTSTEYKNIDTEIEQLLLPSVWIFESPLINRGWS